MTGSDRSTRTDSLSIGALLSQSFAVIGSNPVVTLGGAFLLAALPIELYGYVFRASFAANAGLAGSVVLVTTLGSLIISLICGLLAQAVIIRATAAHAEGRRASLGECLAQGLSKIVPLLLLGLLMGLGAAIGFILLVVPAIILMLMWCVAAPALVVEHLGVVEALGRSRSLTKGSRWKIFGIFLLLVVIVSIVSAMLGVFLVIGNGGIQSLAGSLEGASLSPVTMLVSLITNTFTAAVSATISANLYLMLRDIKEGPQIDRLADVFA